jgi:lipopolysaccharide heptosyltransferase III
VKAAVLPSKGIGDALLMMIASHRLLKEGFEVTTYHPKLRELQTWFPGHHFDSFSPEEIASFDLIIAENDNSARIQRLKEAVSADKLSIFYPTYSLNRHGPLSQLDRVFNSQKTMADNIAEATQSLLRSDHPSKDNGLRPPPELKHGLHPKRVVLHPMSSSPDKNWNRKRYLKLAYHLKKSGFHPAFALSMSERDSWVNEEGDFPIFQTLSALASFIYESGYVIGNDSLVGHLASNLQIQTLIIANDARRMRLWKPGWKEGEVLTPPPWIPNVKFLRLRERYWSSFISTRRVFSIFERVSSLQKRPSLLKFQCDFIPRSF